MDVNIYAVVIAFREEVRYIVRSFREVDSSKIHLDPVIPEFLQVLLNCYQLLLN